MISNLKELLNQDQFLELVSAIADNQVWYNLGNGLSIRALPSEDHLTLEVLYEKPNVLEQEVKDFKDFTERIDDDLFLEICEFLGENELQKIQECISNTTDVDTVRAGVFKFKQAAKVVLSNRILYLQEQLDNL